MKLKKIFCAMLASIVLLSLTACTGAPASSATPKDYAQILHNARNDDFNEAYFILSPDAENAGKYAAIDGYSADMDADTLAMQADTLLQMLNLKTDDLQNFALSVSLMNVKSYAVAILKPADGRTDAVKTGLQAYVDGQKANMQTYLPDQYEIANNAKIVTTSTGEVILVCCEGADDVLASIESALKA